MFGQRRCPKGHSEEAGLSRRGFLHNMLTVGAGLAGFLLTSRANSGDAGGSSGQGAPKSVPEPNPSRAYSYDDARKASGSTGCITTFTYAPDGTVVAVREGDKVWTYDCGRNGSIGRLDDCGGS